MKTPLTWLIAALSLLDSGLAAPGKAKAKPLYHSCGQLPIQVEGQIRMLGTVVFVARANYINFIPTVLGQEGVWVRSITPELKKTLTKELEHGVHRPVIATCTASVDPGQKRKPNPNGAVTGAYLGSLNRLDIQKIEFLDATGAAEHAAKTKASRDQIAAFLKRLD